MGIYPPQNNPRQMIYSTLNPRMTNVTARLVTPRPDLPAPPTQCDWCVMGWRVHLQRKKNVFLSKKKTKNACTHISSAAPGNDACF